jgi:hypothetical protein
LWLCPIEVMGRDNGKVQGYRYTHPARQGTGEDSRDLERGSRGMEKEKSFARAIEAA